MDCSTFPCYSFTDKQVPSHNGIINPRLPGEALPQNRKEKGERQNATASICHCHPRLTPRQHSSSPRLKESRWYWQAGLGAGDNNAGFVLLLGLDWHIQLLPRTIKRAQFRHATIWPKLFFPKTCDFNAANAEGYMLHSLIAADQFQLSGKPVACCRLSFGFETCRHTHMPIFIRADQWTMTCVPEVFTWDKKVYPGQKRKFHTLITSQTVLVESNNTLSTI